MERATFEEFLPLIIKGIGASGSTGNVMEALAWPRENFEMGFEIANEIQNMDLVKLLYSNFNQNKIIVEFTLLGKKMYSELI
jgi:hypothetical protein